MLKILSGPCIACPYRRDVASGVWHPEEYAKLPPYDAPTGDQPVAVFFCHATPETICHGWAVCHSNRGHDRELLALRFFAPDVKIPLPVVPLFASGKAAAKHGLRDVKKAKRKAVATVKKLLRKHKRLREGNE